MTAMAERALERDRMAVAIGLTMRALREKRGLSQLQLSLRARLMSQKDVSNVESGARLPDVIGLRRLAQGLDTTAWNLLRNAEARLEKAGGKGEVTA